MAFSQVDLDAIDKALLDLACGKRVSSVTIGGDVTQFEGGVTIAQLQRLRSHIASTLSASFSPRTFARTRRR